MVPKARTEYRILDHRFNASAQMMGWGFADKPDEQFCEDRFLAHALGVLSDEGWQLAAGGGQDPQGFGPTRLILQRRVAAEVPKASRFLSEDGGEGE